MHRLRLALRLSIGIGSIVILVAAVGQLLDIIPTQDAAHQVRRRAICESLAVHCAWAAEQDDTDGIYEIAHAVKQRNTDVAHLTIIRDNKAILTDGPERLRKQLDIGMVAATVPVMAGGAEWGTVRIVFDPFALDGGMWQDPMLRLTAFFGTFGLLAIFAYCYVLTGQFQQGGGLPDRVRKTLNSFAEGILVLDRKHRIAFANEAFCEAADRESQAIEGRPASDLAWADYEQLPWENPESSSHRATLRLRTRNRADRAMSVRSIAIADDMGKVHGSLATFDDLTTVEQMNLQLRTLLDKLEASNDKIQEQNEQLLRLASRDPLTDCLNRRAFFEQLRPLFAAARRNQLALGCIMVDVDHFKSVNDRHGHAMGDEVLKSVAQALRNVIRIDDLLCRFGGEEFCIIAAHTDLHGSQAFAERCRLAIAELKFDVLSVTASFGVSELSLGASAEELLLEQADQALYVAKETGRNRVVAFHEIERQPVAHS